MDLVSLRTQLVIESGRVDLVTDETSYADNGADYYINAAQRYLDLRLPSRRLRARYTTQTSVGGITARTQYSRAIERVWVSDSTGGIRPLTRMDRDWIRSEYPLAEGTDQEQPLYWCPNIASLSPEQFYTSSTAFSSYTDVGDLMYGGEGTLYDGVLFMPPADGSYTLVVEGLFFSRPMSSSSDFSFWSVRYPELLISATRMMLERAARNSEGVRDWKAVVDEELSMILRNEAVEDANFGAEDGNVGLMELEG